MTARVKPMLARLACVVLASLLACVGPRTAAAQSKPEGEMRWALYVTVAPAWLDPAEVVGQLTPFWILYALHDALVKPMPGNMMSPSLAEKWTVSDDQKSYEFKLREGLKFHNGDPFTAEDVKFSFYRAKGSKALRDRVKDVVIVDPVRVRFELNEPWPDFMAYYGTMVTGAGWIVPKAYVEKVGDDGFKKAPVGLGPYKFVSNNPGVELVFEANEQYWRKVPHVKRLVLKSIPEATTRVAALKRGEVDIAHLLEGPQAEEIKKDPNLRLAFSGGIAVFYLDFLDQWDPKSPWADRRVRLAANYAIDRQALSEAETLGASKPVGNHVPATFEFALPIPPYPYDPKKAKALLAEAGFPNGFDGGDLHQIPPYFSMGEAIVGYLQAVGIKTRLRTSERAAFFALIPSKKAKGLCVCSTSLYGNAASRISEVIPSDGAWAYGGYPDIDELFRKQSSETDRAKREVMLHEIQRLVHERVRYGPIFQYLWPSGIGPRVADPALMKIDPYPWSAPYEDVRLKSN